MTDGGGDMLACTCCGNTVDNEENICPICGSTEFDEEEEVYANPDHWLGRFYRR